MYIGHAAENKDGKPGDSSGKEVLKSEFKYSTSSSSPYNWTYVFRPKKNAEKMASMCEKAIANNYIGYNKDGSSALKEAKKVNYDLSKIKTKCGLSCGELISLCSHYAGLSTCYIGTGLGLSKSLKQNSNYETINYKNGMTLKRGDVIITAHSNGKYNHVAMILKGNAPEKKGYSGSFPTLPKRGYFKKGDKGAEVEKLQKLLIWLGHSVGKAGADGIYGDKTAAAVTAFEKAQKLKYIDGKWGKECQAKAKTIKK